MQRIRPKNMKQPTRTEKAINALQCCQAELSNVRQTPIADMYHREYETYLVPVEGSTDVVLGEVVPMPYTYKTEDDYVVADALATDMIIDTLEQPNIDAVAVDASLSRTRMLHDADTLALGLDMATSIKAKNSMEKLFAHQMAVLHVKALDCMTRAANFPKGREDLEIKMLNVACRMVSTYQSGMETLARTRNGGKQTIVVKQVQVNAGGQAVIADNITRGGQHGGS